MRRGRPISEEAMPISFLVVDDFLSNAEEFRESALKLNYPHREGEYFPGRNSVEPLPIPGLDQVVSSIVQEPLRAVSPPGSHGKVRVALESEAGDWSKVHVDPAYWSGILYLTKDEDCRGGTEFFRHVPTNSHRVPDSVAGLRKMGFDNYQALQDQIIEKDSMDPSKWERTMTIPMLFNRLVLLRPWFWHTAGPGFGDSIENGRLVYLMFFTRAA